MTELPRRYDVTVTVDRDGGHPPNPAEFAVAAERAASARAVSIVSAHTASQIVSIVTVWSAPASLEAAISANCSLAYRIPVPDNRFPHTFPAAYHRYMSGSGPRYTTAPSPLSRASRHRLPASPSSGR